MQGAVLGYIIQKLRAQQKEYRAISEGVQSLLRENIDKYQDRGNCSIYAKESLKHVYESYHNLGGNDVATKLYHTLMEMPEEPKEG